MLSIAGDVSWPALRGSNIKNECRRSEREILLNEGQFFIIPRGVEHLPIAEEECHVMLFEPKSLLNTGNKKNEKTVEKPENQTVSENVQSDLLEALVEHWQLGKPQVVGHDFGGLAALRGHFINGISYGALHLIDAVAVLPSGSPFYAHVAHHEAAFAGLPPYAHEALFRAYIQHAAYYPLREEAIEIDAAPWRGDMGQVVFYRQIAQADTRHIAVVLNFDK